MLGLCCPSNSVRLQKWKTWSNPTPQRPCTHQHTYFLFLQTWDTYLAVQDFHTDVNWHFGNTWLLWFFLQSWKREPPLTMASLFYPLQHPCYSILKLGSTVLQVSCCRHLYIFDGLGFTWSSDFKVYHKMYRSQQCCRPYRYSQALLLPSRGTYHKKNYW